MTYIFFNETLNPFLWPQVLEVLSFVREGIPTPGFRDILTGGIFDVLPGILVSNVSRLT